MANELLKAQIEAALFLSDKPLKAAAVARIVNAEADIVRRLIIELIHDYEARNGGLEVSDDDGYIIQVKDEYTNLVDEFVPIDMPTALIRTLSAIAIKQPVMQSEVIKIRGAGAYDHIKELIERELINKREEGRSPILTTTKKFQEYFRLSKDGKNFRQEFSSDAKPAKDLPTDIDMGGGDELGGGNDVLGGESILASNSATMNSAGTSSVGRESVATRGNSSVTESVLKAETHEFDASPAPDSTPIGKPAKNGPVTTTKIVTTGEDKASETFVDSSSSASESTSLQ
jgi:segregation and condensation protein B